MAQSSNQQNAGTDAELAALKEDLAHLKRDMASLVEAMRDTGKERAASAKATASEAIHERIDSLDREFRNAYGKARDKGEAAYHEVEEGISKHPISTVVAAFGIGFVLAKLFEGGRN